MFRHGAIPVLPIGVIFRGYTTWTHIDDDAIFEFFILVTRSG